MRYIMQYLNVKSYSIAWVISTTISLVGLFVQFHFASWNNPFFPSFNGWIVFLGGGAANALLFVFYLSWHRDGIAAIVEGRPWKRPCPGCLGQGRYDDLFGPEECSKCGGTGKIFPILSDADKLVELFYWRQLGITSLLLNATLISVIAGVVAPAKFLSAITIMLFALFFPLAFYSHAPKADFWADRQASQIERRRSKLAN